MKIKNYLFFVLIILLLFGILFTYQSLRVESFKEFYAKLDFHIAKFDSHLSLGWDMEYWIDEKGIKRMNAFSRGRESTLHFELPCQDTYLSKVYFGFESAGQLIDIYINDSFIKHYKSESSGISDLYFEIPGNVSKKGPNSLKIINQTPHSSVMLEQIKIKNYRSKWKNVYILLNSASILKKQLSGKCKFFIGSMFAIILSSLIFIIYTILLKEWSKVLIDRLLRNTLIVLVLYFIPLLIIYLVSYFSKYFILLPSGFYNIYLCFLALYIVYLCFFVASCVISLKKGMNLEKGIIFFYDCLKKGTIFLYNFLYNCLKKKLILLHNWLKDNFSKLIPLFLILLFFAAFLNRYFFYSVNSYIPVRYIGMGHDSDFIFQTARGGIINPKALLSVFCYWPNAGIIPLVSLFFRFFDIYPGLHYFTLTMILLSTFICFVPYIIISKINNAPSAGGLLAGFLLAWHPLLIQQTPVLLTDTFGLFTLSVMLIFYYLALTRKRLIYLVVFSFIAALSLFVRYVFLAITPVLLVIFWLSSAPWPQALKEFFIYKKYKKALKPVVLGLMPLILFVLISCLFDWFLIKNTGQSYLKVKYNTAKFWCTYSESATTKTTGLKDTLSLIGFQMVWRGIFSGILLHSHVYRNILISSLVMFVIVMFKKTKELIAPLVIAVLYFFALSSTNLFTILPHKYFIVFVFLFSLMIGFVIEYLGSFFSVFKIKLKEIQLRPFKMYMLIVLVIFVLCNTITISTKAMVHKQQELKDLRYAAKQLPVEAVILVDTETDPWMIQKITNKPVIYNIRYQAIYIDSLPYRVKDYTELTELKDLKKKKVRASLLSLIVEGKKLFIVDTYTLKCIKVLYLKVDNYPINKYDFELVLYREYGKDKGIYQLISSSRKP